MDINNLTPDEILNLCNRGEVYITAAIKELEKRDYYTSLPPNNKSFWYPGEKVMQARKNLMGRFPYSKYDINEILDLCDFGKMPIPVAIRALIARAKYYRGLDNSLNYTPNVSNGLSEIDNAIKELEAKLNPPPQPEPPEGRMKDASGLAAINGFRALAEDVLKDAINGTRKTILTDAEAKYAAAKEALAEAEQGKDKIKIGKAKLIFFEAECSLEDIRYSQNDMAEAQIPGQSRAAVPQTNPIKATLKWLKNSDRQYIVCHNEPEEPGFENGAMTYVKPSVSEWRITKPAAFIYRGLVKAAENREIPFAKDAIADFMINNLKTSNGKDITKDSLTKADKRRQKTTKFAKIINR
jgi:hypothetical protein